jgi:hypothetical protein
MSPTIVPTINKKADNPPEKFYNELFKDADSVLQCDKRGVRYIILFARLYFFSEY